MAPKGEEVACIANMSIGACLLAALWLAPAQANADCAVCSASVQHFTTAQGLSHNAVVAMAQDRDRFVWLATRDGLDRLDGTRVARFESLAGHSLRADRIVALAADPSGGLWIGLRDAMLHHGEDGQVLVSVLGPSGQHSPTLLRATASGVWIGTRSGLLRLDRGQGAASQSVPALQGEHVLGMEAFDAGWQVVSRRDGCRLWTLDGQGAPVSGPVPAPCWRTWAYADSRLIGETARSWAPGEALPEQDPRFAGATRVLHWKDGIVRAGLTGAAWQSPTGEVHALWRGREGHAGRGPDGESFDAMIDAEGALWLATFGGAHRFDPDAPAFNGLDRGAVDRMLANRAVSDIVRLEDRWWIGTFGHGMLGWSELDTEPRTYRGDTPVPLWGQFCGDYVWDLRARQGSLFINARCTLDGSFELRKTAGTEPPVSTRDSLVDAQGNLWIVSAEGLYELEGEQFRRRLPGAFETIAETPAGVLWLAPAIFADGPADDAIMMMSVPDGTTRRIDLPESLAVHDLLAIDQVLWAATTDGLMRIDTETGASKLMSAAQPEAGRVYYSLRADGEGALWVGTNRGLLRFDPRADSDRQFRLYDQRDGLRLQEFNRRSHARDDEGFLLFGGMGGVVRFDPRRASGVLPPPQPKVVAARVWNEAGERRIALRRGQDVELAADDLTIALDFAAPGFQRAGHVRYRFRLDGVDGDWVDDTGARTARYPRLDPAAYLFHLQAGSQESGWRDAATPLRVVFRPAWYESWWFRMPAVLTLCVLVWLLYRWRVHRLLEMERLRTRIAADLHDELGSELAAIGMSTAMLASRGSLPERERQRLAGVAASAQQVADSMRDIVWYVNPQKDRIEALGQRLQALARRVLGDRVLLEVADGLSDLDADLPMMVRRELHLICREALTNIARHAGADRVGLQLQWSGDVLTIRIEDDGSGFDPAQSRDVNGLANMQRRAAAIGAQLSIQSHPGQGTRIVLRWQRGRGRGFGKA